MSPATACSWLPETIVCARSATVSMQAAGSAPYPTRSPRQITASVLGAASASTACSASRFAWMSERTAYRTDSERRAEFFVNAIEQAVDEPARLLGAELL